MAYFRTLWSILNELTIIGLSYQRENSPKMETREKLLFWLQSDEDLALATKWSYECSNACIRDTRSAFGWSDDKDPHSMLHRDEWPEDEKSDDSKEKSENLDVKLVAFQFVFFFRLGTYTPHTTCNYLTAGRRTKRHLAVKIPSEKGHKNVASGVSTYKPIWLLGKKQ